MWQGTQNCFLLDRDSTGAREQVDMTGEERIWAGRVSVGVIHKRGKTVWISAIVWKRVGTVGT